MNKYPNTWFSCPFFVRGVLALMLMALSLGRSVALSNALTLDGLSPQEKEAYDGYIAFFEEVYDTMNENYYRSVARQDFDRFIAMFNDNIFAKYPQKALKSNYINWRSAAYLVDYLKDPEDTFSKFFPPKAAEDFEQEVLGERVDLGIEGELADKGFLVARVEPRSDAYIKGLREEDIITKIDKRSVLKLTNDEIRELLNPEIDTTVVLTYRDHFDGKTKKINVLSQKYFKQTVFMVPTHVPGVFCLEIKKFNRKTSDDMFRFLTLIEKQGDTGLILDLRGNPGGPPLAARAISGFFLEPNEEFAYFQKRDQPKAMLNVPPIPEKYHYNGPVVILVDENSGSASELFSGVLQRRGRAVLMGQDTAGKVLLKSMFYFDDESMVALVTGRGYFPDGTVFSYDGIAPNHRIDDEEVDLVRVAANYLAAQRASKRE